MPITFVRVDDRVIHGQVVTRWSRQKAVNGILVIDEKIVKDEFQKKILINAAPPGVKVGIYGVEEGLEKIKLAKNAKNSYFVIVKTPVTLQNLIKAGADFGNEINVGPMSARPDAKTVAKNAAVTEEEKAAFDYLVEKNISVTFQLIPEETPLSWTKVKENYYKER